MSQRSVHKAKSRQAILDSAAKIIRKQGIAGTSVQEAMAGAGLTVGAFYAHFSSKEELLAQALSEAMKDVQRLVDDAASGRRGGDALEAVVARYLSEEHRDSPMSGCPLPAVLGEAAGLSVDSKCSAAIESSIAFMQKKIMNAGDIDADRALGFVALLVGGQILARALKGTKTSSRALDSSRRLGVELARGGSK